MVTDTTESAYEAIRLRIISHQITHDEKINQNKLAQELHVSRTPVVKALHILASEGLVDNIPNKGFYLHKNSLQETSDLFMLRQCVEMAAAGAAAETADMRDIQALRDIFSEFTLLTPINYDAYFKADSLFHTRMIELSGNTLLLKINSLSALLPKALISGLLRSPEETLPEHLQLIAALEARDSALAQNLAKDHLELTTRRLRSTIVRLRSLGLDPNRINIQDIAEDCTLFGSGTAVT